MREFSHPNMDDFECPVCKTKKDAPVVLVPIPGTEDGNNVGAKQVHSECYVLINKMNNINIQIEK